MSPFDSFKHSLVCVFFSVLFFVCFFVRGVVGLKRGRPLFLNKHRYDALKQIYLRHRVGHEVSAIRASSDRVIRENYY